MDAVTSVPAPVNEPVNDYAPASVERGALEKRLAEMWGERIDLPMWVDGEQVMGGGKKIDVVAPFDRRHVLGSMKGATAKDARAAVDAANRAAPMWRRMSFDDRAAVFLKAAELLSTTWRPTINAATMLGQAKTATQAEIDSACELIDFWRFGAHYAREVYEIQPVANAKGVWNRTDYRPLEGFFYAITPFNFTAIAGNLPSAPALMGNTVVWKPSPTQQLAAHYTMALLTEAGLPPGVINLVTGDGIAVSDVVLNDPELAGLHFTGSKPTFQYLWRTIGANLSTYRHYPRIVGETGGKDFIVAHPSADPDVLRTAMIRGAFEYQGQKCSAASRAYVPRSVWRQIKDELVSTTEAIAQGPTTDFTNFMSAVIDDRAFAKHQAALQRAASAPGVKVLAGGTADDSEGYYVRPTIAVADDPTDELFSTEYFGPILGVHVYPDRQYAKVVDQMESVAEFALTGAVIAQDRAAIAETMEKLRFAAGNFYVNDKPTGAVIGQQPFGGGRGSGTNDKAGSLQNQLRWTSARSIKETFAPATDYRYPHMG